MKADQGRLRKALTFLWVPEGEVLPSFQGFPTSSLQRGSRSPPNAPLSLFTIFSMARVLLTPLRQSYSPGREGEHFSLLPGISHPLLPKGSGSPSSAPLSLFTIFSMARVLPTPLRQSYSPGREGAALDGLLDPLWREGVGNPWKGRSTSPPGTQRKVKAFLSPLPSLSF